LKSGKGTGVGEIWRIIISAIIIMGTRGKEPLKLLWPNLKNLSW
jgi:hypothetical protein